MTMNEDVKIYPNFQAIPRRNQSFLLSRFYKSVKSSFFFPSLTSVYLLILTVEGYCCTWSHTLGRTPLDEGSARRRDLYLTTHNTHKKQTPMSPAGFELAIPAIERL